MLLMLFNFCLAEMSSTAQKWTLLVILGVTLIKFLSVAFQFMEIKDASTGWKILITVFILLFVGVAGIV